MKTGVMLINTSRGGLVNTKDLIENLKTGKIGFAGLDVYEEESEYFFETILMYSLLFYNILSLNILYLNNK